MQPKLRTWCETTRARMSERDASLVPDIGFALAQLREAVTDDPTLLPDGRIGTLEDLQRKRQRAAETVHDPSVIDDLLQALETFLNEELRETPQNEPTGEQPTMENGGGLPTPDNEGERARAARAAGSGLAPEGVEQRAPASDEQRLNRDVPQGATRMMQCEACGHHMEMMPLLATESDQPNPATAATAAPQEASMQEQQTTAAPAAGADVAAQTAQLADKSATLTEAARPAPPAGGTTQFTEAERMEYVTLKAAERKRQEESALREKATAKLKEADPDANTGLTVDDLIQFQESQWPTLINMADKPPRYYGTGPTALGGDVVPGQRARVQESAADFYDRLYAGRAQ